MAKDNIYDLIISELILRVATLTATSNVPNIILGSSLPTNTVAENFNGNAVFTSQVVNMPSGYTIVASSHIITYPTAVPTTIGSGSILSGPSTNVIMGAAGSTFTVTTTATITNGVTPIVLTGSYTITATAPVYYGVKAFSATPDTSALATISSTATSFQMTTSVLGRMYIVTPLVTANILSITDQNGLMYTVAGDFTVSVVGGLRYYILNYDTQLTGTNIKTFTLNFI